jgi:hypothetical protein
MPETGVTIYEHTKSKGGFKDYYDKFKKFSKHDYYNMLKETAILGSSLTHTEKNITEEFRVTLPQINQTNTMMMLNSKSIKTNTFDSIKVSAKVGASLKNTFDELELMPEFDEMSKKYRGKAENVLKKKKTEDNKEENLDEMNKFTLNILKNKTWGDQPNKESRMRFAEFKPVKPSIKDLEKEVGSVSKIPRLRK